MKIFQRLIVSQMNLNIEIIKSSLNESKVSERSSVFASLIFNSSMVLFFDVSVMEEKGKVTSTLKLKSVWKLEGSWNLKKKRNYCFPYHNLLLTSTFSQSKYEIFQENNTALPTFVMRVQSCI